MDNKVKMNAAVHNQGLIDTNLPNTARAIGNSKILTIIGSWFGVALLVLLGLMLGVLGRLSYEPRLIDYKFERFISGFPFKPTREETTGVPPFSTRLVIKYEAVISNNKGYQLMVMNSDLLQNSATESDLKLINSEADSELEQWTESTIALLCANEQHLIKKDCLEKGSRLTRWSLVTSDGVAIRGSIFRAPGNRLVQMLALGTSEDEAAAFFETYQPN